jgi:hypothetical protein
MAFSFPQPVLGTVRRPSGQGCKSCVHSTYCPSMYWFKRYGIEGRTIDNNNGIQCASWSNNMADQVKSKATEDDLNEADYIFIQGTGSEADRCGLTDAITASNRKP